MNLKENRIRINSLKANLIEYYVGGISIADRDSDRALLEDAIKNCRSAVNNGVGYGANVEGYTAAIRYSNKTDLDNLSLKIANIIINSYKETIKLLYGNIVDDAFLCSIIENGPYNMRTCEYDGKVLSSIMSDIVILEAISKIIVLMATSEQFILPAPQYNTYKGI